jgi:hypothetical protein
LVTPQQEIAGVLYIEENKFREILFPKQRYASSLYKALGSEYLADLSNPDVLRKIEKLKERELGR